MPGGGDVEVGVVGLVPHGFGSVSQTVQRAERHGLHDRAAETDDLGRDRAFIAGDQLQPVTTGGKTGQSLDFHHQSLEVGDGAVYPGVFEAL